MGSDRVFRKFSHRGASFTIMTGSGPSAETGYNAAVREIIAQREILTAYIEKHPDFLTALVPMPALARLDPSRGSGEAAAAKGTRTSDGTRTPDIVKRMHSASLLTGIGPMASVAGVNAQLAAEAAVAAGAAEALVENGGDIYLFAASETVIALYAGGNPAAARLAFKVKPGETPLSICASSSRMGHSLSFGDCDLAVAVSADGALADSAATLACNLIKTADDIGPALERIMGIKKVIGVLIIKDDKIGMAGALPELIKNDDPASESKVTRFSIL